MASVAASGSSGRLDERKTCVDVTEKALESMDIRYFWYPMVVLELKEFGNMSFSMFFHSPTPLSLRILDCGFGCSSLLHVLSMNGFRQF